MGRPRNVLQVGVDSHPMEYPHGTRSTLGSPYRLMERMGSVDPFMIGGVLTECRLHRESLSN